MPRAFNLVTLSAHNPGPMTGTGNHTYLVEGSGSALLIDAGVGVLRHRAELSETLRRLGAHLDHVAVTHAHADHISGVTAIQEDHPRARFQKFPWPEEDRAYAVGWTDLADVDQLRVGEETLDALHTPGHSPDHMIFHHRPTGTLFTGDLVISGGSVVIPSSRGGDLRQYLRSLERARSLAPTRLLPAHGPEVLDPASLLTAAIEHRMMREQQVLAALSQGLDTVTSIVESIYHDLLPALVPAARENVRAHLEKLKQEQRAIEAAGHWRL